MKIRKENNKKLSPLLMILIYRTLIDIRPSATIKALFANISWTTGHICTIELVLESTHQTILNDIWYIL